jgi:hypothetical protein
MPTTASLQALQGLRDPSTFQWYAIPLLAFLFYVYTAAVKRARATGDWNAVLAGATVFGMDFINETVNGWIFHFTQRSALWTAPGPSALRTMVGWNFEIMVMFAVAGLVYYNSLPPRMDDRVLGIPARWFFAILYSAISVVIEVFLNAGGHLVWEYSFWNRNVLGLFLIFVFGYLTFYVMAGVVIGMKRRRTQIVTLAVIYGIPIVANAVALGALGWKY